MMTQVKIRSFYFIEVLALFVYVWIGETFAFVQLQIRRSTSCQHERITRALHHGGKTATCCYLFAGPLNSKNSQIFRRNIPYDNVIGTNLPWSIDLKGDGTETMERGTTQPSSSSSTPNQLSIRLMEYNDIESIVTMNVQEYGAGPAYFPWSNPSLIEAWIDRQYIRWLVDISCRIKLFNYLMEDDSSFTSSKPTATDHAILVGILKENGDDAAAAVDGKNTLVGMIEVSLQPLNPQVTPSPIPVPIDMKRAVAVMTTRTSRLVGWITNLLIAPQHRGCGYSKYLIAASEQLAKSNWNCTSIHLHCDADPISGMVPQKLYKRLGYGPPSLPPDYIPSVLTRTTGRPVDTDTVPYIVEIEGVPLLYLRKDI